MPLGQQVNRLNCLLPNRGDLHLFVFRMQLFAYSWKLPAFLAYNRQFEVFYLHLELSLTIKAFLRTIGAFLLTMGKCVQ